MEIVNEYSDEGKSRKSVEGRPEFQRMLDNIENGTEYKDYFYYACKHRRLIDGHKCGYLDIGSAVQKSQIKKTDSGCGDSNPDSGGTVVFMAHGTDDWNMGRNHSDRWQATFIFDFIRDGDGCVMAVLFSCPSERGYQ